MAPDRPFEAPKSVGEPFRADPSDAAPFLTEHDNVPAVPVDSSSILDAPAPPLGSPPSHADQPEGSQPVFRTPAGGGSRAAQQSSPEERFAKVAMWVGVASIFIFQLILGTVAVFMGVSAYRRGQKQHGRLAIIFGGIGIVLGITTLVLVSTGVLDVEAFERRLREMLDQRTVGN